MREKRETKRKIKNNDGDFDRPVTFSCVIQALVMALICARDFVMLVSKKSIFRFLCAEIMHSLLVYLAKHYKKGLREGKHPCQNNFTTSKSIFLVIKLRYLLKPVIVIHSLYQPVTSLATHKLSWD